MQHMKRYETDDLSVTTRQQIITEKEKNEVDRQF